MVADSVALTVSVDPANGRGVLPEKHSAPGPSVLKLILLIGVAQFSPIFKPVIESESLSSSEPVPGSSAVQFFPSVSLIDMPASLAQERARILRLSSRGQCEPPDVAVPGAG